MKNIIFVFGVISVLFLGCHNESSEKIAPRDSSNTVIHGFEKQLYTDSSMNIDPKIAYQIMIAYARFAHDFSDDTLSPEYLFKAGEIARALYRGNEATIYYKQLCEEYPDFEKTPTAMFLLAFTYENVLKDTLNAKKIYEEFINKYPDNQFIDDAQYSLKYLGKSPEELMKIFEENEEIATEK